MEKKILIIDTVHDAFKNITEASGFSCIDGTNLNKQEVIDILPGFEGVVIRSRFRLDEEFFSNATALKFVARSGAGMENIEEAAALKRNIALINAPEGNRDAVAEHALSMLLALFNRIIIADKEVRNGIWLREENRGVELMGKCVGVIGFGNMGSSFAKRLTGFGVEVLAYDPYIKIDTANYSGVRQTEMEEIFNNADIVSLHIPLTAETNGMVNDHWLSQFRKNIYIINTARGKVLQTSALVKYLKTGKVAGACLDVSEYESSSFEKFDTTAIPSDWKYILESENVILSPHVAGWTVESYRKLSEVMAEKVLKLYHLK